MTPPPISRRSFLVLAGGTVLLAACGSSGDDSDDSEGLTHFHGLEPGVLSGDLYASPRRQRLAFAMFAEEGFASGPTARLAVAPPGESPGRFVATTLHTEGLPERRGVYVASLSLPVAGTWTGVADTPEGRLDFAFEVKAGPDAPVPGDPAPRAASPTAGAPLGVDPICTHEPPCPLHTASLDTLVGAGRPVAVCFATPARCTSQYCGPVLDTLLPMVRDYVGSVEVVHVDIYRDLNTVDLSPTVAAWGLPSEPWLFGVDGAGRITERLDGAFGGDEMRALLDRLAGR